MQKKHICRLLSYILITLLLCNSGPTQAAPLSGPGASIDQASDVSKKIHPYWNHFVKSIIHELLGDDSIATLGVVPRVKILKISLQNAYAIAPDTVVLTEGLLETLSSRSEFAFVIAHELGHLALHREHQMQSLAAEENTDEAALQLESDADRFAITLMRQSNFDIDAANTVLNRFAHRLRRKDIEQRILRIQP